MPLKYYYIINFETTVHLKRILTDRSSSSRFSHQLSLLVLSVHLPPQTPKFQPPEKENLFLNFSYHNPTIRRSNRLLQPTNEVIISPGALILSYCYDICDVLMRTFYFQTTHLMFRSGEIWNLFLVV